MNPFRGSAARLALTCAAWAAGAACLAAPAGAQTVPPPPQLATLPAAPAAAEAARAASAALPAARPASAPGANLRVIEDDQVRIEEVRDAHGRLQRVTVHSKVGGKSYEIIVPPGGKDNSQHRGTSGQAAWRLFDF